MRAINLVGILESHHSKPWYGSVRKAVDRLGMSWNQGWKGGYWTGAKRSPKKKPAKKDQVKGSSKGSDALPGYDSEAWLPSSSSSRPQSASASTPSVGELTKLLHSIVNAGKIELPEEAKQLLQSQTISETKDNIQKDQRLINIRRKAHGKLVRLQSALESKKEKFAAYKSALREQLVKETERFDQDVEGLEKAIAEAKINLEKIEAGDFGDPKDPKDEMEEHDLDTMLDLVDSKEKAQLHALLANTEKEKQEAMDKANELQYQMQAMQAQFLSLQALHAPLGSQRLPLNVSPVPSEDLAKSPQLPKSVVRPFSRASTSRPRDGPYTELKKPCTVEANRNDQNTMD